MFHSARTHGSALTTLIVTMALSTVFVVAGAGPLAPGSDGAGRL